MANPSVQRVYKLPCSSQRESPLFSKLPWELRNMIFSHALSEYEDLTKPFDENTYFTRPGYRADKHTDTSLLLTCQRIYNDAWYLPWMLREITLFLTEEKRSPEKHVKPLELEQMLAEVNANYGAEASRIPHIRIFAQMYHLESGKPLQSLLDINHFYPVCLTIGIRHTDWWFWEKDERLHIASSFVNTCRFPNTIKEIRMELETIERRIPQVQEVAKRMKESWAFTRLDGTKLTSPLDEKDKVESWEGSSILTECRWVRDESKPGRLQYYIQTVRFRVEKDSRFDEGHIAPDIDLSHSGYQRLESQDLVFSIRSMTSRGIALDASPDLLVDAMRRYRHHCRCSINRLSSESDPGCCLRTEVPEIGSGWRDEDSPSDDPLCSRCQLAGCEVKEVVRTRRGPIRITHRVRNLFA